ncbi:predicted protein [Plenodomus lingam JN3]|uniref:Predicted protein n=1 Tax=Leptosphaeria maculans (strain JN3 / isolate v23.1.3 / race Av1-4-5-6-7-8) TaxID=985895 RepID=E4ZTR3_LEPMJ|nr:predicted protein [Plenodomus lingam JN3]CBX94623.1 predicted protein [Plenodomus lingam JN3]
MPHLRQHLSIIQPRRPPLQLIRHRHPKIPLHLLHRYHQPLHPLCRLQLRPPVHHHWRLPYPGLSGRHLFGTSGDIYI